MKKIIAAIALLVASTGAIAQTKTISKAKVSFELKNLGIKTGGVIGGIQGNINFDPANLPGSKIEATADVNSINTDNDMRDAHLKKDDYFAVDKYPKMSLSSVSFKKSGTGYVGQFNLTIKGRSKAVEIPFSYAEITTGNLFKGTFKINRKDFDIGGNSMTLSDDVTIIFEAETAK